MPALLTASNLVPLLKFAHGKPNGIRPIACGEVFYRIAASFCVSLFAAKARDYLFPLQLAVAVPSGCETAALRSGLVTQKNQLLVISRISANF